MYLSIVIPCYNEYSRGSNTPMLSESNNTLSFESRLNTLLDFSKNYSKQHDLEVILVDDGSQDGSSDYFKSFIKKHSLEDSWKCIEIKPNKGKSNAIRTGFKEARGTYVLMYDADMSVSLNYLYNIDSLIDENTCIIGNRYSGTANIINKRSLIREFTSKLARFMIDTAFHLGVPDTQCGFKLFPTNMIRKCSSFANNGWLADVEFLYCMKVLGVDIKVVDVVWNNLEEETTVNIKSALVSSIKDYVSLLLNKRGIRKRLLS